MSVTKSELKIALVRELCNAVAADLAAAERDVLRSTGRAQASVALEQEITKIVKKLEADMSSNNPPFDNSDALLQAKRYLGSALAACMTVTKQSDGIRIKMEGKVEAFQHTINRLQKICDSEETKINALELAEVAPRSRPVGMHPGPSVAARRRAESERAAEG